MNHISRRINGEELQAEGIEPGIMKESSLSLYLMVKTLGECIEFASPETFELAKKAALDVHEKFIDQNPKPSSKFLVSIYWASIVHLNQKMTEKTSEYFFKFLDKNLEKLNLRDAIQTFYILYKLEKNGIQWKKQVNLNVYFKKLVEIILMNQGKLNLKEKSMIKEAATNISFKGSNLEKLLA